MDNKITKSRFSSFIAYEWIKIIVVILVAVFFWEFMFAFTGVRLSHGQQFKVLYDEYLSSDYEKDIIYATIENKAFSYDVIDLGSEFMYPGLDNIIDTRYQTFDGDVVVTSHKELVTDEKVKYHRTYSIIDAYNVWSFEKALKDGESYLKGLLKKEFANDVQKVYDYDNLDPAKIENLFRTRMKKDNRFRSESQKKEGIKLEKQRIQKICENLKITKYLLENHPDLFLRYTKYTQRAIYTPSANSLLTAEKAKNLEKYGSETVSYGINLEKLVLDTSQGMPKDKFEITVFFINENSTANDLVMLAYDFTSKQRDLQFESLSFINTCIKMCSNLLDNVGFR